MANATLDQILPTLPVTLSPFCAPSISEDEADGEEMEFLVDDGDYSDLVSVGELADTLAAYDEAEVTYTLEISYLLDLIVCNTACNKVKQATGPNRKVDTTSRPVLQ